MRSGGSLMTVYRTMSVRMQGRFRVGVHPDVLAETARLARQRLGEMVTALREELSARGGHRLGTACCG